MKKRALVSVSDKTGVIKLCKNLLDHDYEIISTGGSAEILESNGIPIIKISEVTEFNECLNGRVKTLHPKIHAGILAIRSDKDHMMQLNKLSISPIDIVVVNLYPFKETINNPKSTFNDAIENIDIGGPSMIRAAAKNYNDVLVVIDPADYDSLIAKLKAPDLITDSYRYELCVKAFEHTAYYDSVISNYLKQNSKMKTDSKYLTIPLEKVTNLRYGENPHQSAMLYKEHYVNHNSIIYAEQLNGKELSYNNISDADTAVNIISELSNESNDSYCVAIKHGTPCGVGLDENIYQAYLNCLDADPISIFGGIVAFNNEVDEKTASKLSEIFLELIIAPSFSNEAITILKSKKNLRVLKLINSASHTKENILKDYKKIKNGLLIQDTDNKLFYKNDLKIVTEKAPSIQELNQLIFGFKIVKHVKSNAIVLVKNNQSIGIGSGQTNRITSLNIAIDYAKDKIEGSLMASDAFLPFEDCVTRASEVGIKSIIQPGGSIRDDKIIEECNKLGISMVFTNMRHFKH